MGSSEDVPIGRTYTLHANCTNRVPPCHRCSLVLTLSLRRASHWKQELANVHFLTKPPLFPPSWCARVNFWCEQSTTFTWPSPYTVEFRIHVIKLDLSRNRMRRKSGYRVADMLLLNKTVTDLNLSDNKLDSSVNFIKSISSIVYWLTLRRSDFMGQFEPKQFNKDNRPEKIRRAH